MQFDATTVPREDYTIAGETFKMPAIFSEGEELTLTEGLADRLNQDVAENVRNNFAAKVKEAKEAGAFDAVVMQEALDAYIQSYEFGVRQGGGGGRAPVDPVMREALAIADKPIRDKLAAAGHKLSGKDADVSTKDFNALKKAYVEKYHDTVWPMAEARVASLTVLPQA